MENESYEHHQLIAAIDRVDELRQKAKDGTPAKEFYDTIWETLLVLNTAIAESRQMRRAYDNMVSRVQIMERVLADHVKPKE